MKLEPKRAKAPLAKTGPCIKDGDLNSVYNNRLLSDARQWAQPEFLRATVSDPDSTLQNTDCDIIDTDGLTRGEKAIFGNGLPIHDPETGEISPLYVECSPFVPGSDRPKSQGRPADKPEDRRTIIPGWTGPRGALWYDRLKHDGYRVSKRVISDSDRQNAIEAAGYMIDQGRPPNLHIVLKPPTDHMSPLDRMRLWPTFQQKWRVLCGNHGLKGQCMIIAVRESHPDTHDGEHEHWLVYAPPRLHDRIIGLVKGWCKNAFAETVKADGKTITDKAKWLVGYVLKAASQVSVTRDPSVNYRRSGAVLGKRVFLTRNIDRKQREANYEADRALQRARGDRLRGEKTEKRIARERRIVAGLQRTAFCRDSAGNRPLDQANILVGT